MAQTNKLPNIQISTVGGKKSYIPLTHDVYATHRVGKIVPYMCRFFDAGSKIKADVQTLEYNAPMVAPTVGDVKFKQWHYFVGLDKILPNFADMFAKNPDLNNNLEQVVKTKIPYIKLRYASMLALIGAHCTVYVTATTDPWRGSVANFPTTAHDDITTLLQVGDNVSYDPPEGQYSNWENYKHLCDYMRMFRTDWTSAQANRDPFFRDNSSGNVSDADKKMTPFIFDMMPYTRFRGIGININALDLNAPFMDDVADLDNIGFIPLANPTKDSLFDWWYHNQAVYSTPEYARETHGLDCSPVSFENPDAKISRTVRKTFSLPADISGQTTSVDCELTLHFCFRLSDFGRAIRDIINARGLQMNFSSNKDVSFLPFIAIYMAYYHCQSLQMYENYKMTYAYKLMKYYDYTNTSDFNDMFLSAYVNSENDLTHFVADELSTMWAICPQDFVSCHMRQPVISPKVYNSLDQFTTSSNDQMLVTNGYEKPINQGQAARGEPDSSQTPSNINTPYIDKVAHDVYVAEILKRLTLRMNVNTLEGRKTRQYCIDNGYGEWLDLQNVDFIDYGEMNIQMKPVVSQSDTSNDEGKGADLGQYGGRGYGSGSQRGKTYVNKVPGYYIVLTTIYVDAGYCQAIDPYNYQVETDDFFRRDFDSIGYDLNTKDMVYGLGNHVAEGEFGELDKAFGYAPRDMKYKQISNILLGAFCCGTQSDIYDKYHLERLLPIGHQPVVDMVSQSTQTLLYLGSRFKLADMPLSGNIWRFLGMFPWIGQYDRIFKLQTDELKRIRGIYNLSEYGENLPEVLRAFYTFFVLTPENYTLLNTLYVDTWQDKIPISRSFGTLQDIFDGAANKSVKKE